MIKKSLYFIALAGLISCEQQESKLETETAEKIVAVDSSELKAPDKEANWLNPQYLTADFNGDGHIDTAIAIIINNKKGIRIKHGNTNEEYIIGAGNDFGNGGDDFDWVKNWNLVTDSMTNEVTFMEEGDIDGSRDVKLDYPAFYIGTEEEGGATVAWKEGKYVWIHQAD
ncbi:hypothetical protein JAO76_07745 [Pontibacter sp. BT310]|uniref:VCBS repeat-containing protein n=1 Tax=Pontibacter populi TaxID=890055 RepID=A0ABS6XAM7_9BACT|nr:MULTISPECIES: hypothetical protein [Pontibacter]MBJ6118078.1 hypothetical protein [Pontibacter sp. BT310]MBR0570505.1 hypothetical protein [Microvirga sp. STS03]MBW3364931.1 hypothetical protein [Pontibacter populi]